MGLNFIRIDDRLIHGQIVTLWMQYAGANAIVVANDAIAADSFTSKMIAMAAPSSVKVCVHSLKDAAKEILEGSLKDDKVLVLVKTAEDAFALRENGLLYDYLNVGNMASKPGSKIVYKNTAATDEQMELLQRLKAAGVTVEFKIIPSEKGMKI